MNETVHVHVVDDEAPVRKGLERLLRAGGIAVDAHRSAEEFLSAAGDTSSGCVVLDFRMPGLSGLEVQEQLTLRGGRWQIVFLTGHADVPATVRAMKGGAVDFLVKPAPGREILGAVQRALERHRDTVAELEGREAIERCIATLTPREREVMNHVIAGRMNKQIASALGTAEKTVKIQRSNLMRKMGVRSVAELVRLTERIGIQPQA